jgi:hypothetical protein
VRTDDSDLNTHSFHHNLWATPDVGSHPHYVAPNGQTVAQWDAWPQTSNETYRSYSVSDLNGEYEPQFDASTGVSIPGVFTDIYGNARPDSGPWTIGAVELIGDPGGPPSLDVNGDGAVNIDDVLLVISNWGACPSGSSCPADVDDNGVVNVNDLLAVLDGWTG